MPAEYLKKPTKHYSLKWKKSKLPYYILYSILEQPLK